jgi:hypothetical protein
MIKHKQESRTAFLWGRRKERKSQEKDLIRSSLAGGRGRKLKEFMLHSFCFLFNVAGKPFLLFQGITPAKAHNSFFKSQLSYL